MDNRQREEYVPNHHNITHVTNTLNKYLEYSKPTQSSAAEIATKNPSLEHR